MTIEGIKSENIKNIHLSEIRGLWLFRNTSNICHTFWNMTTDALIFPLLYVKNKLSQNGKITKIS